MRSADNKGVFQGNLGVFWIHVLFAPLGAGNTALAGAPPSILPSELPRGRGGASRGGRLRPGELCELQRGKQLDESTTLRVHGSNNVFGEHTRGKTSNAVRTFVLPEISLRILREQEQMLKMAGIVSAHMFPDRHGNQSTSCEVHKCWKRYQAANGLDGISLYELRHTFVSICKGTIPKALIKPVVGHRCAMPIHGTYVHAFPGELQAVADMVGTAYSDVFRKEKAFAIRIAKAKNSGRGERI